MQSHFILELLLLLFNNTWDLLISYLILKLFIGWALPGNKKESFFFLLVFAIIVSCESSSFVSSLVSNSILIKVSLY